MVETPEAGRETIALEELKGHVGAAYNLLIYATENSAQLPNDILAAIATASESIAQRGYIANTEDETRFWNAYSVLYSNKLADQARRAFRHWLYALLIALVGLQIYYLAGALTVNRLSQVEAEWQGKVTAQLDVPDITASDAAAAAPGAAAPPAATPSQAEQAAEWDRLRRFGTARANYYLGTRLMPFLEIKVPPKLIPRNYDPDKANFMVNYMKLRAELDLILRSLSGYILPLLYGTLGAFAFVLRKLSDPVAKLNFANDTWFTYTFRLHIGAVGGLAVGWFINGNEPITGIGALSPLALAFAAGYGSDLLFAMMDKVVGAFTVPSGLQSTIKSETTTRGGVTIMTETQRTAAVSGTTLHGTDTGPDAAGAEVAAPARLHAAE